MTLEPTAVLPTSTPVTDNFASDKQITILEDLFNLGFAKSEEYKVYVDDRGLEINVQYRTLTAGELRDIAESLGNYRSMAAQVWTEKIETLARTIVCINRMPLVLDTKDRKEFEEKNGKDPNPLQQARVILHDKIKSPYVIDLLFDKYQEFVSNIAKSFDDVKKKLNNPAS